MSSADITIEMERKVPRASETEYYVGQQGKKKRGFSRRDGEKKILREGWELNKFHTQEDRELARKFPAHIGGAKTPILPALPERGEKWWPKWPEDFSPESYTFGYSSDYPIPSDKKITREIQLRKFAGQLAKRLEYMPKDTVMRNLNKMTFGELEDLGGFIPKLGFGMDALERAIGDPSGYSLGRLAYPRGFQTLPLPRDKRHEKYFEDKDEYWGAGSKGKRRGLIRRK